MAGPKQSKTPIGMAKMLQNLSIVAPDCCRERIKQSFFRKAPCQAKTGASSTPVSGVNGASDALIAAEAMPHCSFGGTLL